MSIEVGQEFTISHPFVREKYSYAEAEGYSEATGWRPGVRMEAISQDDAAGFADGIGEQILTVVSIHKPGKFPTRVFFTRKWRDPSGRLFGKSKLHILSQSAFTCLTKGYRHRFKLERPAGQAPDALREVLAEALAEPPKADYNAAKGQFVCPQCLGDCGGFCERGDRRYEGDV